MAVGVGGLVMDLMGRNPSAQLGQALAGPQPNPQPMPGGAPSPQDGSGGIPANATANAPPSPSPQAPAQTYAPDPTNARTIDKLLSLYQSEATANDLNRNIAMMGSAFGTAQQQHDKLAAIQGMPQGGAGALGAISDIQNIQKQQLANEEASRFAAGSATLLQSLGIAKDPTAAATIGADPMLTQKLIEQDFVNKSPTNAIKDYDQAYARMKGQGLSDDQINQIMPPESLMLGPGADLGQRQYVVQQAQARRAGQSFPDYETWKAQVGEKAKEATVQGANVEAAGKALPGLVSQLDEMHNSTKYLQDHRAQVESITSNIVKRQAAQQIFAWKPDSGTPDPASTMLASGALSQDEVNTVTAARQLHLADYAAPLKGGGTQRFSQQEAARMAQSADQLGDFSADANTYMNRVGTVENRIYHAEGTARGEAQDFNNVKPDRRWAVDPSFFEGGTNAPLKSSDLPDWMKPRTISSKDDYAALPEGQSYKTTTGPHQGRILIKGQEDRALAGER